MHGLIACSHLQKQSIINKKLSGFDEDQLKVILEVVEKVDGLKGNKAISVETIFEETVAKYGNVLKKLAQ